MSMMRIEYAEQSCGSSGWRGLRDVCVCVRLPACKCIWRLNASPSVAYRSSASPSVQVVPIPANGKLSREGGKAKTGLPHPPAFVSGCSATRGPRPRSWVPASKPLSALEGSECPSARVPGRELQGPRDSSRTSDTVLFQSARRKSEKLRVSSDCSSPGCPDLRMLNSWTHGLTLPSLC